MYERFATFTLATNGMTVVIALDNIAFAMRIKEETSEYTRVFLKELLIDDEAKWVDIKETPDQLAKMG